MICQRCRTEWTPGDGDYGFVTCASCRVPCVRDVPCRRVGPTYERDDSDTTLWQASPTPEELKELEETEWDEAMRILEEGHE